MISIIRDFDKKWIASDLSSALHPPGFEDNKFLSWWFTYFEDTRDMYHVYVLYLVTHFGSKAEDFPGIHLKKLSNLYKQLVSILNNLIFYI